VSRANFSFASFLTLLPLLHLRLADPFIQIHVENSTIILLLLSLRFEGGPSTTAILDECKGAALRALDKATTWEDRSAELSFASNYVVVDIACVLCFMFALHTPSLPRS
jgi:hypothetical protein